MALATPGQYQRKGCSNRPLGVVKRSFEPNRPYSILDEPKAVGLGFIPVFKRSGAIDHIEISCFRSFCHTSLKGFKRSNAIDIIQGLDFSPTGKGAVRKVLAAELRKGSVILGDYLDLVNEIIPARSSRLGHFGVEIYCTSTKLIKGAPYATPCYDAPYKDYTRTSVP